MDDDEGTYDDFDLAGAYAKPEVRAWFSRTAELTVEDFKEAWTMNSAEAPKEPAADAVSNPEPGEVVEVEESNGWGADLASIGAINVETPTPADYYQRRKKWRADHLVVGAESRFVNDELQRRYARDLAESEYNEFRLGAKPKPDVALLSDLLQRPAPEAARIEGLFPWDASVTVVAQNKVGKTTFVLNLARSLITGEPFLGKFPVQPIAEDAVVCILNYEVSDHQIALWCSEVGIPADRLLVANLRGKANPLTSDSTAELFAEQLREHKVETLIVDPFGRAVGGADQNSAREVQPWLNRLDAFAREMVGARDLVLVVHTGWNGERSRGSSTLEDWPDAKWFLTKDAAGLRYFRAEGRDVDVPEDQLAFDPETRLLTLTDYGSRSAVSRSESVAGLTSLVLQYLKANPGASGKAIETQVQGHASDIREALKLLVFTEEVTKSKRVGKGGGYAYFAIPTGSEGVSS